MGELTFQSWIGLAQEDYETATLLYEHARYPYAIYLLCQAIEKLLKAAQVIVSGTQPKKTHNLYRLGIKSGLPLGEAQIEHLKQLNKHYSRVRYRDLAQAHYNTKRKVTPFMEQGEELYQWILSELTHR